MPVVGKTRRIEDSQWFADLSAEVSPGASYDRGTRPEE